MLRVVSVPALSGVAGLVHGFEQRSSAAGQESREATRARVASALAAHGTLLFLRQVHGATVVEAPWRGTPEADAGVATAAGLLLGVETADCLPVLLVDPVRGAVAAAHAGWRGTAAGVATRVVEALIAAGSRPQELLAALGPAIGPCCYEVGDELRAAFGDDAEQVFLPGSNGRPHLDLRAANLLQLKRAGVRDSSIGQVEECTRCDAERYHSYRRDGKGAGRMISYVGFAR